MMKGFLFDLSTVWDVMDVSEALYGTPMGSKIRFVLFEGGGEHAIDR